MAKKKLKNKTQMLAKRKSNAGRKPLWDIVVVPQYDQIIELRAKGATYNKIWEFLGISKDLWFKGLQEHPEFNERLARARMKILHEVRGAMINAALGGEREEQEIIEHPDGSKTKRLRKIRVEPHVGAGIAILKNAGEWSENPLVDEAVIETAKTQAELNRKIAEQLGFNNPRSSAKDEETPDKNIVSDETLAALGA